MLTLHVMNANGDKTEMYFDNIHFKFYKDKNGTIPILNGYDCLDNLNISIQKKIIITLGYGCKNKCLYCIQKNFKNPKFNLWKLVYEIKYLKNIYKNVTRMHFIGGEPLLQFDIIKQLVRVFRESFKYSVITNGLHLTDEMVSFFIENKFSIAISHDGEYNLIQRGTDVFKENSNTAKLIHDLSENTNVHITSVQCGFGTSLKRRWEYFNNLPFKFDSITVKPVIPFDRNFIKLVPGVNNWDEYFSNLLLDIYTIPSYPNDRGNPSLLTDMIQLLINKYTEYDHTKSTCTIFNDNAFTLNQSGYYQYCHNCLDDVKGRLDIFYTRYNRKSRCVKCPIVLLCMTTCRLLDDTCFKVSCDRSFHYRLAYFVYFVHQTFNCLITSIEGDFHHAKDGRFDVAIASA